MKNQKEKGLVMERVFSAPPAIVWKYWTVPVFTKKWWGPKTFSCPVSKIDLRVGGKYLNCMKSPDGKEFWSTGIYKEIKPMKRLVMSDSFSDERGNVVPAEKYGMKGYPLELEITVIFEEVGRKTKMTLVHSGLDAVEVKQISEMEKSWNELFDKLQGFVE